MAGGVFGFKSPRTLHAGTLVRFQNDGFLVHMIDAIKVRNASDVTFGGADLSALFFVSIAMDVGGVHVASPNAGRLMRVDNTGFRGRLEPRVRL